MKKISIFVVSHKKINLDKYPGRNIIYVGANHNCTPDNRRVFVDNSFDNISKLNSYYCELTALYWIGKNYPQTEYIGFEHYRRNFYHKGKLAKPEGLLKKAQKYNFYHSLTHTHLKTIKKFGCTTPSGKSHFLALAKSIKKINPKCYPQGIHIMDGHRITYCNIFVCKGEYFDKYMKFILPILNNAYKNLSDIPNEYRSRSIGHMAERLFNVFIKINNYTDKSGFVHFNKKIY